ncbi:insulinase family protein [Tissierella creatinini]|nr:insulinase family protein [Tissierella creatinini]TJX64439.1 insulinase family protein [Soehngenia saccharolytica]
MLKSKRIEIGNGVILNLVQTDKFKSNLLSYYFLRPLNRDDVTKNALLPLVLKRGTKNYPDNLLIEKEFENMYGASYSSAINKRGERHIIRFTMEWASGDYLLDKDQDLKVIKMLKDLIFNPYLEDGVFKKDYVAQEIENHKNRIEGKINDKRQYAIERCLETMCKNENFSLYQLGYTEDLKDLDEKKLFEHYNKIIDTSIIEIFYVGNVSEELEKYLIEDNNMQRDNIVSIPREKIISTVSQKTAVSEKMDVNQGKLVIGYRTGIPFEDKLYNALLIASDIFGGGPNSKLFRNVREKESLAYYIGSSILKYKSLMIVDSGIEFQNYNKTVDIINEQLEELKGGKFSDEDIEISKKSIKTSTESIKDSAFLISEFFFSQNICKDIRSLEDVINDFDKVTKADIISAAESISIDTIYFMKGKN